METIGKRIKQLREEEGWTQRELAKKLNMLSHTTVVYWETGRREPNNHYLVQLANVFDVTTDYLLGRTKDF